LSRSCTLLLDRRTLCRGNPGNRDRRQVAVHGCAATEIETVAPRFERSAQCVGEDAPRCIQRSCGLNTFPTPSQRHRVDQHHVHRHRGALGRALAHELDQLLRARFRFGLELDVGERQLARVRVRWPTSAASATSGCWYRISSPAAGRCCARRG
jgi:hypothetical protein